MIWLSYRTETSPSWSHRHPLMIFNLPHLDSFLWVNCQQTSDQIFNLLRNFIPHKILMLIFLFGLVWKVKLPSNNFFRNIRHLKRMSSINHIEEYDSTSPNINTHSIRLFLPSKHLRRHILQRSSINFRVVLIRYSTDSKIWYLDNGVLNLLLLLISLRGWLHFGF